MYTKQKSFFSFLILKYLRDGELREHPRLCVGVRDAYEVRYGFYCQSDKSDGEQRISMNIERVIQRDAVERSGGGIC